jgi:peptidoglycan hydrolase-like protein with peptidoglycan-binding domain
MTSGVGKSTNPSTATNLQTLPIDNQPASFRYNNPGAQFPSKEAAKFGQLGYGSIDSNKFKIALFPNPVNGAAANLDLLYRNYTGMAIGAAGTKWTGANGFGVPGYDPNIILTKATLDDSDQAIALLKAIAGRESGKGNNLTEDQWRQAHAMFKAGSADAYLGAQPAVVAPAPVAGTSSGAGMLQRARQHIGEKYVNVQVPKDDANYKGPWDCAEFISWLIYQESHIIYGCTDDSDPPAKADAYTGAFKTDAARLGKMVSVNEAASTVGGILLRYPPAPGEMGHIVLCDGSGGTIEAKGTLYGVVADTVHNRTWDTGLLIPGFSYSASVAPVAVTQPTNIYQLNAPHMDKGVILRIQTALLAKGYSPGSLNGEFNNDALNAVVQFQTAQGLTIDGQVGPETAAALGISLKPDGTGPVDITKIDIPPLISPPPQTQADSSQLLALVLMLLSKETPMATDPAKPGQPVDPVTLLLPLLLQSVLSGKQIDPTQLLGSVLTGQTVTPAPVAPAAAAPAAPAAPAAQAAPAAPAAQPQQVVSDLVTLLLPLLYQKLTGQAWPSTTTTPAPQTTTATTPSVVTNPSVQIGAAGLGIASLLQAFGVIAPPFATFFGKAASTPAAADAGAAAANTISTSPLVGTLATVIPLVVAGLGATGGWSSLIGIGSSLIGAIANAANKPK